MDGEQNIPDDIFKAEKSGGKNIKEHFPEDSHAPKPKFDKPETENMEVHHHGHVHHQKKWKEYLFQFLMLFLAVFCGFLAEYKLEHVIEHNREKQFIKALVEDLKLDTIGMRLSSDINKSQTYGMDTLARMIWDSSITKRNAKRLYSLKFKYTARFSRVSFSRSALTQLKNSGNLRLIRNMKITDEILKYDLASDMMDGFATRIENFVTNNYEAEYEIFNDKFWRANFKSEEEYEKAGFDLLTYDTRTLNAYASRVTRQKVAMETYTNRLMPDQKLRAEQLIAVLKKEYRL